MMKTVLTKFAKKYWWMLAMFFLIPSVNRLIHKGFFSTQDFIYVARIYEMDRALKDGQFPVRWVPDFRYGEPLFNFYAPLPYYLGSLIHTFGISFLDTAKVLYALGFILSFFSMYLLGKELWGKIGGLVSAFIYLYAPYRALDVYVRGDLSESWVFIFFPLAFLGALKLSRKVTGNGITLLSLSLAGLFLTHNVMTMLFAPFFVAWILYLVWNERKIKKVIPILLSSLLGVGLAASFLLPAFFEKNFIQTQHLTGGYFDFRAHFVEVKQFFSTFWGYGASTWLGEDGMSFQLGTIQWVIVGGILIASFIKRQSLRKDKNIYLIGFLLLSFLVSLFLQHNKSTFIWLKIPLLQFVQFPWRFMAISTFFAAILAGSLNLFLPKFKYVYLFILAISLVFLNFNYFRPDFYYDDSIDLHYTSQVFEKDDKMPKDYLPIWVKKISPQKLTAPAVIMGKADISGYLIRSDSAVFDLNVLENATIDIPITYFPGWMVKLNGKKVTISDSPEAGIIRFVAPPGEYEVVAFFGDTLVRKVGNIISVASFILVLGILLFPKKIFHK